MKDHCLKLEFNKSGVQQIKANITLKDVLANARLLGPNSWRMDWIIYLLASHEGGDNTWLTLLATWVLSAPDTDSTRRLLKTGFLLTSCEAWGVITKEMNMSVLAKPY